MKATHPRATTNGHIRRQIQDSNESIRELAKRFKINPKTVQKWKKRNSVADLPFGTKTVHYVLGKNERRIIAKIRKHLKIELDDLVDILKEYIPKINRSNCYRVLVRHQLNQLPVEIRKKGKFAFYLPGYLHIDTAYLPKIERGKKRQYLFVAIDRVNRLVFVITAKFKTKELAVLFLNKVIDFYPYRLHRILTDNGGEFTYKGLPPRLRSRDDRGKELEHPFTELCGKLGIKHKRIKFRHAWTNGMVERMNGKIKNATVKKYVYQNYKQLERDLIGYINHYNLETKLKSLNRKTPFEKVVEYNQERPDKFYKKIDLESLKVCAITS